MSEYYARSTDDRLNRQQLKEHLRRTAERCAEFAVQALYGDLRFANVAEVTALLHDMGKYRVEFQRYLAAGSAGRRTVESAHAMYGAAAACFKFNLQSAAFAIAGHHAGLHDASDLQALLSGDRFQADRRYPELLRCAQAPRELGPLPPITPIPFDESDDGDKRRYELLTRMLFSMLVDADRLDSEKWEQEQRLHRPWDRHSWPLVPGRLLELLENERRRRAERPAAAELLRVRNEVFDACMVHGRQSPQGFFALTVPTGGAKTLSSMAFGLSHAQLHALRRVIVVIPYLSIIEQNARDYRSIFGGDQVVEDHSAVDVPKRDRGDEPARGDDPPGVSEAERAMENWDAPIIVTTSVQFMETLFAASPNRARKLHNVARSVVIFDEVQTLPAHLLDPTLDVLRELRDRYGCSLLFCSATQPAFRRTPNLKAGLRQDEIRELAPAPDELFRLLRRVNYRIIPRNEPWNWNRVADEMLARPERQVLCIVNLRRHAFELWSAVIERLRAAGRTEEAETAVFHLSSAMCAAHRLKLLGLSAASATDSVLSRLRAGQPCWVISTQLIEAGVDVDFPVVFRAMGPLDAIVQAAGRCNREGLLRDDSGRPRRGEVVVFHPADAGLPRGIYEKATAITSAANGQLQYLDPERLATDPALFASYFSELYQLTPTDVVRKGEATIQADRAEFNFRSVADKARVIRDDTVSVVVPYGRARKLIAKIRQTGRFDRTTFRKLQRYLVSVRRGPGSDLEKLAQAAALEPLLPGDMELPVLGDWCYDPHRGVVIRDRPPEDFIV